jgi:hypothetical protein
MSFIDSTVQSLIDAFNGGPSNWQDRLEKEIVLTSPEGTEFRAMWRGSPRSMAKKIGVLKHPKIKGDIVQDMEVSSSMYPITFYFAGDNNDKTAAAFFYCCKERGQWEVIHPVHGLLGLQLISVEEVDDPVESGNITELKTEWIEPIDPTTLKTTREMRGIIDAQVAALNVSAAQQFANNLLDTSNSLRGAIQETTKSITRVTDLILRPLFTTVDALDVAENAIQNGITDTYNATILQAEMLAGQVQELIQLPLASNNSLESRLGLYDSLIDAFVVLLPGSTSQTVRSTATDDEKKNAISVIEMGLMANVAAMGGVISTTAMTPDGLGPDDVGALATRAQAVKAASDLAAFWNAIVLALETAQEAFATKPIDKQFYSALTTYNEASLLIYLAIEYLLNTALQLSIERRFTLDRPRAPIEVTITEYGKLGDNDEYLDLFIRSNDLHGKDIALLPRGKEVVVYV